MPYFIEEPIKYDKEYLDSIDITKLVDEYESLCMSHLDYYDYEENYWYKPSVYKRIIINKQFEFYSKDFEKNQKRLNDFYTLCEKYDNHIKYLIENESNLNEYYYDIIHMKGQHICDLFEMIKSTLLIFPERLNLPKWAEDLPFPDFGGDEEGRYFCLDNNYDEYDIFPFKNNNYNWKSKQVKILVETDTETKIYEAMLGRTEH